MGIHMNKLVAAMIAAVFATGTAFAADAKKEEKKAEAKPAAKTEAKKEEAKPAAKAEPKKEAAKPAAKAEPKKEEKKTEAAPKK
jgi:elongation factor 1-gamma